MREKLQDRQIKMEGDIKIRMNLTQARLAMNKLMLIARLKLTKGPLFIVNLIEIIKQTKEIFINEIKQGKEVRIPDKLTIKYNVENKTQLTDMPLSL